MVAVLRGANAPSQEDFHAAIAARSDRWFSACLRILGDAAAAEDAVQEALLTAWNKRNQFQHGAKLETWIHRIAVNAALQMLRKKRPELYDPHETELVDRAATPEQTQYHVQLDDRLLRSMNQLTDIERASFVLKHLEEWRYVEIADELDIKVNAIKQAVFRAVKKLRGSMTLLKDEHA